jgi:hypothetical protein
MRIQDFKTQEVIDELQLKTIPPHRLEELKFMGDNLEFMPIGLPMFDSTKSMAFKNSGGDQKAENTQLHTNAFWRSQLAVIGIEGLPTSIASAGNVIYKELKFRCSMRLPPGLKSTEISAKLNEILTAPGDDTFGSLIEFKLIDGADGFDAPDLPEKFKKCLNEATADMFG